jgi:hypothetical protein
MWNFIHKYGTTICSNGWDNVAIHLLLNLMLFCPNGDIFLGAIDTIEECKDAHYICNALVWYIEIVGWVLGYVLTLCTLWN